MWTWYVRQHYISEILLSRVEAATKSKFPNNYNDNINLVGENFNLSVISKVNQINGISWFSYVEKKWIQIYIYTHTIVSINSLWYIYIYGY